MGKGVERRHKDISRFIGHAKITIAQVRHKPVEIKFAPISLLSAQSREVEFLSPLRLPADDYVEYEFEMTIADVTCRVTGHIVARTELLGVFHYKARLDLMTESGNLYIRLMIKASIEHNMTFAKAERRYLDWMEETTPKRAVNCLA